MEQTMIMWLAATMGFLTFQFQKLDRAFKKDDFSWKYWLKHNLFSTLASITAVMGLLMAQPYFELWLSQYNVPSLVVVSGSLLSLLLGYGNAWILKWLWARTFGKKLKETGKG